MLVGQIHYFPHLLGETECSKLSDPSALAFLITLGLALTLISMKGVFPAATPFQEDPEEPTLVWDMLEMVTNLWQA